MHLAKSALLIVLLVIPHSNWRDWQRAHNPALQTLLQKASIGQMMPRTAERDKITPGAEIRTILSGARMDEDSNTSGLGYPVLPTNLEDALVQNGWQVAISTPSVQYVAPESGSPSSKIFEMWSMDQPLDSDQSNQDIGNWMSQVTKSAPGSMLIVTSDSPSISEYENHQRLCPIALWQPNQSPGLLISPSTRTLGLVANTDLAPTIAKLAGFDSLPGPIYGAAFHSEPSLPGDSFTRLTWLSDKAQAQDMEQIYVPWLAVIIALIIAPVPLLTNESARIRIASICIAAPALLVLSPNIYLPIFGLLLMGLVLMLSRTKMQQAILGLLIAAILIITFDVAFDHPSMVASSILGFSFQEGARYYGLGNEAMGAMVGAMAVITSFLAFRSTSGRLWGLLLWCVLAVVFALPSIGAKAGGVLVVGVAVAGFLAATWPKSDAKLSRIAVAGLFAAGLIAALGVLALSVHFGGDSHVALDYSQTQKFGSATLISLITRKLSMDFRLMLHSTWMLVLIASLFTQEVTRRKWISASDSDKAQLVWRVGMVSTLACLFLNDAGVVAAALCSLPTLAQLCLLSAPTYKQASNAIA